MQKIIDFIKSLFKKAPREEEPIITEVEVECPRCGWAGSVYESLHNHSDNDRCPLCGYDRLSYWI